MRGLKTWACAVVLAASASPALAQLGASTGTSSLGSTNTTGGTRNVTNTGGISSGTTGSSTGTGTSTGSSSGAGSSSSGDANSLNSSALESIQQQNLQFSNIGITSNSSLQKSNVFASFYSNPYAQGVSSASGAGGFGRPLYTITANPTGGTTGATAGRTGVAGGRTGQNSAANQSGILIPLPVQINYAAEVRFAAPPVAAPRLQADVRGAIDAGGLAAPAGVQVIADANNNVILRGTVKDDDERRLAEGLVRLTPGVRNITNELVYPGK